MASAPTAATSPRTSSWTVASSRRAGSTASAAASCQRPSKGRSCAPARKPSPTCVPATATWPGRPRGSRSPVAWMRSAPRRSKTRRSRRQSPTRIWPRGCSTPCPRPWHSRPNPRRPASCTDSRLPMSTRAPSARSASPRAAWSSAASASSNSPVRASTAPIAGTSTAGSPPTTPATRARSTSRSPGCLWILPRVACSTRPWSFGPVSSVARRSPRGAMGGTTIPSRSRAGSPAAAHAAAPYTAKPTSTATRSCTAA